VRRLALTEVDRQGRDQFVRWAREAGLAVRWDAAGNIFARREGAEPRPPVMMGSHLDSQPSGGRFDGAYGVMAGLEVLRTLNDHKVKTRAPVEVASWTNEEGSRFAPGMAGSGVFAGVHSLRFVSSQKDLEGVSFGEALERIGYAGAGGPHPVGAYFEAHIEQGRYSRTRAPLSASCRVRSASAGSTSPSSGRMRMLAPRRWNCARMRSSAQAAWSSK
jgi:N-carbamoyl-L-amino-acid hydrolase